MKLEHEFYLSEHTAKIARDLLGKLLVVPDENGAGVSAMIVETEAYLGTTDRAAHSYGGRRTPRNEVMYGVGGHAYAFVYGMYYQFNVVTSPVDRPHAILIRGVEPVDGIETTRAPTRPDEGPYSIVGPGKALHCTGHRPKFERADLMGGRGVARKTPEFRG